MYNANTREEAEVQMASLGSTWEWQENGSVIVTTKVLPAVINSSNGRKSFVNLGFFSGFTYDPEPEFET